MASADMSGFKMSDFVWDLSDWYCASLTVCSGYAELCFRLLNHIIYITNRACLFLEFRQQFFEQKACTFWIPCGQPCQIARLDVSLVYQKKA